MTKLISIAFLLLVVTYSAASQTTCPSGQVCLDQATANRLFNTVEQLIEAKDVINKMLAERGASDAAIASANKVIEGYKQLDLINGQIIAKQRDVIALYEQTLKLYADLVQRLETQLNKPKSAWSKFLSALKTVVTLAAGVALGRGL